MDEFAAHDFGSYADEQLMYNDDEFEGGLLGYEHEEEQHRRSGERFGPEHGSLLGGHRTRQQSAGQGAGQGLVDVDQLGLGLEAEGDGVGAIPRFQPQGELGRMGLPQQPQHAQQAQPQLAQPVQHSQHPQGQGHQLGPRATDYSAAGAPLAHAQAGSGSAGGALGGALGGDAPKRTRASGEVLALLVNEFNKNANPSSSVRKRISDQTGMTERSVRIWFQNRRAKSRKQEKSQSQKNPNTVHEHYYKDVVYGGNAANGTIRYDGIPLTLNRNYFFVDGKSLTVGSWRRLKSGNLSSDNIFSVRNLSNLSPFSINDIMTNSTDLMIIISKKNFEINYFFSAISDTSKTLFRIFFPISSVANCSLSLLTDDNSGTTSENESTSPGNSINNINSNKNCELKLVLNKPPKFAVFLPQITNSNQWSICDDFSEGHQVNDAFVGGSGLPHVFFGLESSLRFMNSFILDYNSANLPQHEFNLPPKTTTMSMANTSQQNSPSQPAFEFPENSILQPALLKDFVNHDDDDDNDNDNDNNNRVNDSFDNFISHQL